MRYIRMAIDMLCSDVKLLFKKLLGCKVDFGIVNLASPFSHIYTEHGGKVKIGNKTEIKANTEIKSDHGVLTLGNNCFVNRNCMIIAHERITIADQVTIGPGTCIYDHDHNVESGGFITSPVEIKKGAWIGAGCIILKGVTVGENAIVAAGSIVTKNIPPKTVFYQKRENVMKQL